MWAVVLVACFVAGCAATAVLLRVRSARVGRRLADRVASGDIRWGGQARWRRSTGSWGASGLFLLTSDGELQWCPDKTSTKRGVQPQAWPIDQVALHPIGDHRDITGLQVAEYRLIVDGRTRANVGVLRETGERPPAATQ